MMEGSLEAELRELKLEHSSPPRKKLARYCYEALGGPDKIRTLQLHASKNRIDCSLRQISFSEGEYQALSYVWGSPEKRFEAVVLSEDGKELGYIPLTTNLQAALCDLRDAEEIENKVFWIDQICINQEGTEKNGQVALMGQIYRNASRVITYVGSTAVNVASAICDRCDIPIYGVRHKCLDCADWDYCSTCITNPSSTHLPHRFMRIYEPRDSEEEIIGIGLLKALDEHFADNYELIFQAANLAKAGWKRSEFPVKELPKYLQLRHNEDEDDEIKYVQQGWRWLLQMAYGEWTRRLWIVQEQMLNNDTVMLHGTSLLSWDVVAIIPLLFTLRLLPGCYTKRFWRENPLRSGQAPANIADSIYALWHERQGQKIGKQLVLDTLLGHMSWHEYLECWDPRDRIFALLAISSDTEELGIKPDYSEIATAGSVFLDVSVRLLKKSPDLRILIYACRWASSETSEGSSSSKDHETPSWALSPFHHPFPHSFVREICTPHPQDTLSTTPRFVNGHSVLVLKGRYLDQISMSTSLIFLAPSMFLGVIDQSWIQSMSQVLGSWAAVLLHLGPTIENATCLCRAIVTSPSWEPPSQEQYSVTESAAFHFWCYFRYYVNVIRQRSLKLSVDVGSTLLQCDPVIQHLATKLRGMVDLETSKLEDEPTTEEYKAVEEMRRYILMHGRSFCVTKMGRVCNAMNQAKQGDVIAALQGSDRLWILRPIGQKYRLIGDAYVDGLMNGEAYEGVDPDDVDHDIELI